MAGLHGGGIAAVLAADAVRHRPMDAAAFRALVSNWGYIGIPVFRNCISVRFIILLYLVNIPKKQVKDSTLQTLKSTAKCSNRY